MMNTSKDLPNLEDLSRRIRQSILEAERLRSRLEEERGHKIIISSSDTDDSDDDTASIDYDTIDPANLCEWCRTIDFYKICRRRQRHRKVVRVQNSRPEQLDAREESPHRDHNKCVVCSHLHILAPDAEGSEGRHSLLDTRSLYHFWPEQINGVSAYVVIKSSDYQWVARNVERHIASGNRLLEYQIPTQSAATIFRSVEPRLGCYQLIRSWIRQCEDTHKGCGTVYDGVRRTCPTLTLIDCEQQMLVRPDHDVQYLALSYVWGTAAVTRMQDKSNCLAEAPLTVRDAMHVVKSLEYRYLWVDRYCVDQRNNEHTRTMIQNMDLIFANAVTTIVALHGEDPEAGLPGVSSVEREGQVCIPTRKGRLLSSCPPLKDPMSKAKWSRRGWTYQEARLSRRCIFFSKNQAYFACAESVLSEANIPHPHSCRIISLLNPSKLVLSLSSRSSPLYKMGGFSSGPKTTGQNYKELSLFWQEVAAFSHREFTFNTDVLDTFRGLLARSRLKSFWGIPVQKSESSLCPTSSDLAYNLAWSVQPGSKVEQRREGFPSWSWTGTLSPVYHRGMAQETSSNIKFWQLIDGQKVSLEDIVAQSTSQVLSESSSQLLVEGLFVETKVPPFWMESLPRWSYLNRCRLCETTDDTKKNNNIPALDIQSPPTCGLLLFTEKRFRCKCRYWIILLLERLEPKGSGRARRIGITCVRTDSTKAQSTVFKRDKIILE